MEITKFKIETDTPKKTISINKIKEDDLFDLQQSEYINIIDNDESIIAVIKKQDGKYNLYVFKDNRELRDSNEFIIVNDLLCGITC